MKIIAIDLGKFNSRICFYDSKTQDSEFLTAATRRDYLEKACLPIAELKSARVNGPGSLGVSRQIDAYRKPFDECAMEELWPGELDQQLTQLDQLSELLLAVERKLNAFVPQ